MTRTDSSAGFERNDTAPTAGGLFASVRSAPLSTEDHSTVNVALLYRNNIRQLWGVEDAVGFTDRYSKLRDARDFANPDPRPKASSPAPLEEGEGYVGAFGRTENWLDEWTVLGAEGAERDEEQNSMRSKTAGSFGSAGTGLRDGRSSAPSPDATRGKLMTERTSPGLSSVNGFPAKSSQRRASLLALLATAFLAFPASAQNVVTLVSNTGQGDLSVSTTSTDRAQAFTTGSHAAGYTLDSIEIVSADVQGDDATVAVYTVDADGFPDTLHASLTAPGSFAAGTLVFTAPANTTLAANTTYTVVIGSPGLQVLTLPTTLSADEDAGGAAGWSIADVYDLDITFGGTWDHAISMDALQIAVKGSPISAAPPPAGQVDVPVGWELIPSGLGTGDSFRLLFVTSTTISVESADIADYNTFVQGRAAAGHTVVRRFSSLFRAVGSTASIDARDNTSTTGPGVPIYWLGGAKLADDYADFYDGSWDDEANRTDENGNASTHVVVATGSNHNGTTLVSSGLTRGLGGLGGVAYGTPNDDGNPNYGPLTGQIFSAGGNVGAIYALSPVFTVAAATAPSSATGSGTRVRNPQPLQLALWTDQGGYRAGETVRLYRTVRPHDDRGSYRTFVYLEQADSDERRYLAPLADLGELHPDPVDLRGIPESSARAQTLQAAEKVLSWEGEAPAPGLWQFVMELRPDNERDPGDGLSASRRVRRAWAHFTVAEGSQLLGRRGFVREVRSDLTLHSDTIYYLGHQLFVHAGATLTIEPGTVVRAYGRHTAIIVERGGRIVAEGTREAPVVLGCSLPTGHRWPGCWGGLRILGKAPVTRLEGAVPGVVPAERPLYGGTEADDSSGSLRHVRVEFAGAAGDEETAGPGIGLYGAGSGTVLDHVQVHASLGDGFAFYGGSAVCGHCVASGAGNAGLSWERGWRGGASQLYVQHGERGLVGLAGGNDDQGHDHEPRSLPTLSNVTLVHAMPYGRREREAVGLRLGTGSGVTARDLLVTHFGGGAIEASGRSAQLFTEGESSVASALLWLNGIRPVKFPIQDAVEYTDTNPRLRDVRYFANPDPRPKVGSPALLEEGEGYIGAFGRTANWLEEWTVFGPESDYDTRGTNAEQ